MTQRRLKLAVRARTVLIAGLGVTNLLFGVYCIVRPTTLAELAGVTSPTASVLGELRAVYGGLVGALGLALLAILFRKLDRPEQVLLGVLFAGLSLGRLVSIVVDGPSGFTLSALGFEGGAAAVLWWNPTPADGVRAAGTRPTGSP
ncbi:MAG: DUF4345 family protein [Planctomycetota bacterium]